jgi:hypothetical protein
MKKIKFKIETWVSITAIVTAVSAIVFGVVQSNLMQQQIALEAEYQRMSVQPALNVFSNSRVSDDDGHLAFYVVNQGLGPAVVEDVQVTLDGKHVKSWRALFEGGTENKVLLTGPERNVDDVLTTGLQLGLIIPVESTIIPVRLRTSPKNSVILRDMASRAKLSICYCSLFGECWKANNARIRPEPVKLCKADPATLFTNTDETTD